MLSSNLLVGQSDITKVVKILEKHSLDPIDVMNAILIPTGQNSDLMRIKKRYNRDLNSHDAFCSTLEAWIGQHPSPTFDELASIINKLHHTGCSGKYFNSIMCYVGF
jgi:hypothetical protein